MGSRISEGDGGRLSASTTSLSLPGLTALAVLIIASVSAAQSPMPAAPVGAASAVRAERPPVLDGREDDAVWQRAQPMTGFRQFEPGEDREPTFKTEARAAYDDKYLYVLVRAFDPHPDSIVKLLSRRDVKTTSDQITILLDAFHDRRTGVQLAVNPAGVKIDAAIQSDIIVDPSWEGVWDVAVRVDDKGWVAEFRVPFSQLRFNPGEEHAFGFGVWRDIARLNERNSWPLYRKLSRSLASQLGTLGGIRGIPRARRLELLPYAVAKSVTEPAGAGYRNAGSVTGGLDIKAGVTPNVTVDATVNPDFGQVEADPAILNLSAFEVRFDERRPFFQEGGGLYKCGGPCEGPFYTRRIGRTPQLRASSADPAFTTILGAAKLTGRFENGNAIGIVDAVTRREVGAAGTTIEPLTNYLVMRVVREMRNGRAQLGSEVTDVRRELDSATDPYLRRSATVGIVQGFTRFADDRWELMAYTGRNHVAGSAAAIARTQRSSVHYWQRPDHERRYDSTRTSMGGESVGAGLKSLRGRMHYDGFFRYATAGGESNDMGFVPLVNDIMMRNAVDFQQRAPSRFFRSSFSIVSTELHWTTGGLPAERVAMVHASASLHNNWGGALTYTLADFASAHCVSCARGGPALRQSPEQTIRLDVVGDARPAFVPKAAVRAGSADAGRSWSRGAEAGGALRIASRFSMSLAASYDRKINDQQWIANYGALLSDTTHYTFARLDQHTLALTSRANWTATPALSFQLYAQPFVSAGSFSQLRELAAPRARSYDSRFRPYGAGASPAGFNVKQFNSNAVIRWEYQPASVLFLVWQQGRLQDRRNPGSFDAPRDIRDLFEGHPDNTLLLKLSYWFNP